MKFGRFYRNARGASAIEFAILAAPFFMMLFGVIEGGRLLWTQVGLQHAVETAARCASLKAVDNPNPCPGSSVESYAATQAFGLNLSPSVFTVSAAGCGTQITANYRFSLFTNFLGPAPLNLSAQSCVPS
jgi:Flp pilus assembly protein TadG